MMETPIQFRLTDQPIDAAALKRGLDDPVAGAQVTFDGTVRNHHNGRRVAGLEYQSYPALAVPTGRQILEEECARHGLTRAIAVHRTGRLEIGDSAVWVGVAAAHRGQAFDGARAIMERLKYELPVWKKETYVDGTVEWVGPDNRSAETGQEVPRWQARLESIWISTGHDFRGRHGGERMSHGVESVREVECVAGMGLRGDRYFGHATDYKGQVTFFAAEVLDRLRETFGEGADAGALRRNLIVRGIDLQEWVGRRFRFQGVEFEGSEECKPCYWMDQAIAPGAEEFLKGGCRGGLRARILSEGVLRIDEDY